MARKASSKQAGAEPAAAQAGGRRRSAGTASEPGKVTLEMVAAAAGVSPSTVSRILNGTAVVSDDKRAAVDEAVARLGFVPNPMARGLAGGRTLSIGVVTQAIDSPFYGGALRGVEEELSRAGYSPLFVSGHWNAAQEARCIETLRSRRVDGIIVLTGRLSDAALTACAQQLPVVVTGRRLQAPGLYSLHFDNFEGGRLATHHLLSLGHRRIAFITGEPRHPDAKERQRGYLAALAAAGLPFDPALVVPGHYTEDSGRMAVERLLDGRVPFTAIFAANDQMAFGAGLALHRRRLHVPDDVSLVGFDDLQTALFSIPPLSTVHHPVYELGQLAASAMLELLAGQTPTAQLPAPRFIVRESARQLGTDLRGHGR
ncbi:MAG: LacI family DNA-binding transcriptional regulator [Rubrivivax sp.]|nr:LacI family DNA-binding transcriptional regulator [Rubrivivax sp.]